MVASLGAYHDLMRARLAKARQEKGMDTPREGMEPPSSPLPPPPCPTPLDEALAALQAAATAHAEAIAQALAQQTNHLSVSNIVTLGNVLEHRFARAVSLGATQEQLEAIEDLHPKWVEHAFSYRL